MHCPSCFEPMTLGAVVIHNDAMGKLFGSPSRSKHLYFIPQGEAPEMLIASGRELTEAFRCHACSMTVITSNSRPRP